MKQKKLEAIGRLPDEVITLDLPEIEIEDDFEVEVIETQPHSLRSLEVMGDELYESLSIIRKQLKQQKGREENPTMLDANIHTTFDLFVKEDEQGQSRKIGRFASEQLAEKVGKFHELQFNNLYKIVEEKVFVSTMEFVEAQGSNSDYFLRLLSPNDRNAFLKKRALAKLTPEERQALGLS